MLVSWRKRTQHTARKLLKLIGDTIQAAYAPRRRGRRPARARDANDGRPTPAPGSEAPAHIVGACEALADTVDKASWNTTDASQLILRMLCATPFSAHDVRQPRAMVRHPRGTDAHPPKVENMPLCRALGHLLDMTVLPRYRARPYATAWLAWAYHRVTELAGALACATEAPTSKRHMPCTECAEANRPAPPVDNAHAEADLDECAVGHAALGGSQNDAGSDAPSLP